VEFVTFALAGAAASIRRVEAVLMGRPGSWEAEGIRQLLVPTAGDDQLLAHRTEPVVTNLYVDEITLDAGVWAASTRRATSSTVDTTRRGPTDQSPQVRNMNASPRLSRT
jgi:hypothetical protein